MNTLTPQFLKKHLQSLESQIQQSDCDWDREQRKALQRRAVQAANTKPRMWLVWLRRMFRLSFILLIFCPCVMGCNASYNASYSHLYKYQKPSTQKAQKRFVQGKSVTKTKAW